jgi:LuxR family maltose regulon positive regulatory protein
MQPYPLLQTKLYVAPFRPDPTTGIGPGLVSRPRLVERLNAGLRQNGLEKGSGFGRKLTLVSAPAGFGKTTLMSEWVAGTSQLEPKVRIAWLSLDEGDNDPTRFLFGLRLRKAKS